MVRVAKAVTVDPQGAALARQFYVIGMSIALESEQAPNLEPKQPGRNREDLQSVRDAGDEERMPGQVG